MVGRGHLDRELPSLERHVAVDLALRQHAGRLEHDFLDFCRLAEECIAQSHWARFGYPGPQEYFEERVGISYRSLRRRLSVLEALKRLPEAERPEAEAAVIALGSHKSAALARAIGREGVDWRQLVEFAQRATAEAVQERVTIETGGKPRGDPADPGERFYRMILNTAPPDYTELIEETFGLGMRLADTNNPLVVFLMMIAEVHNGWATLAGRLPSP